MPDNESYSLERLEKTSTFLRNIVLIIGAVAAGVLFVWDKFDEPINVYVDTFSVNTSEILMFPKESCEHIIKKSEKSPSSEEIIDNLKSNIGSLREIANIRIRNSGDTPVTLEIRLPKQPKIIGGLPEEEEKLGVPKSSFLITSIYPSCSLNDSEILKNESRIRKFDEMELIKIATFPPDCSILLTTATTSPLGFLDWDQIVEVYYDGRLAKLNTPSTVYGKFGIFAKKIQGFGSVAMFLGIALPLILFFFFGILLMQSIIQNKNIATKNNDTIKKEDQAEK